MFDFAIGSLMTVERKEVAEVSTVLTMFHSRSPKAGSNSKLSSVPAHSLSEADLNLEAAYYNMDKIAMVSGHEWAVVGLVERAQSGWRGHVRLGCRGRLG